MVVQVEDVGPCKKLLKIEVPPEKVTEELEKTYKQLNDNVVVPGFRKGHVPRWLMQSRFGKQVNDDTKETLLSSSFQDAVKEKSLRPIGQPKFDEEIPFEPGQVLSFGVTIEVRPEFEIDDYAKLELTRPPSTASESEVAERIEAIRRRYAKLEDVTDGNPKPQDVVLCHVALAEGEAAYRDIPKHQFIVGEHVLVGLTADETTALVTGTKVGETAEREITLPDTYPDEAKRGAKMKLSLKIEGIRRPLLPEVNAEWLKGVGFDSEEEFEEEVRGAIRREKEQAAHSQLEEQLMDQLLAKVDFELPQDVISSMAERTVDRRVLNLRYQGVPPQEIEKQLERVRAESRESAGRVSKLFFILDKIADKERLFVTEDEVNARVEAMAANYHRSPDQVWRDLEANDRLAELRSSMREEKVKAFLLEKAVVTEGEPAANKASTSSE